MHSSTARPGSVNGSKPASGGPAVGARTLWRPSPEWHVEAAADVGVLHAPRVRAPSASHLLTIILEDYFHNFGHVIERSHWNRFETRVERGMRHVLDLLDVHDIRATFFAVGWIAETLPELIREIANRGHEVASKGFDQRGVRDLPRQAWREDLAHARAAIESASGRRVLGYRSPGWIREPDLWALRTLAQDGYLYDSSIKPLGFAFHDQPHRFTAHQNEFEGNTLWEFPVSTTKVAGVRFPIGTGNYVRQLPEWLMQNRIAHWSRGQADPFVMYFHTWELDPDQPQITAISPILRTRFYRNIDKMQRILGEYFQRYQFTSLADYLGVDLLSTTVATPEPESVISVPAIHLHTDAANGSGPTPGPAPTHVSLVVPCYNEESSLPYLANTLNSLEQALAPRYAVDFVLVDDRSVDETWMLLQRLFGARANCTLVRHEQNYGPAIAILNGIRAARSEIVASIDCDCSYDPVELARMLPLLKDGVSMVTASPYHPKGTVRNVPEWRLALSRGLSGMYRVVLHQKLSTYTSCFRVYRRSAMVDMTLTHGGFLGIAEMLGRLDLAGSKIVEYPTTLSVRVLGYSKMKVARTIFGHLRLLASLFALRLIRGQARGRTATNAVPRESGQVVAPDV